MPHLNGVREIWDGGKPAANGWLSLGSPLVAELYAQQGFDSVTVDMQHGMFGISEMAGALQAIRAAGAAPLARAPALEAGIIGKLLDAGALGLICPMINNAKEAAQLVRWCRYPPLGERSYGPTRASAIYPGYASAANTEVLVFAMIETRQGVENLSAIAATPGLDALYIGPADLTLALEQGRLPPGFDRQEPEMIAVIRRIIDAAHAAGIKCGLHCGSSDYAARAAGEWGADLVTLLNDARILTGGASDAVKRFRGLVA